MFSQRVSLLRPSPIRQILSVVDRPGMVSFAGGLPASDMLPEWAGKIDSEYLQYGATEGEPQLREIIAEQLRGLGIAAESHRVMILSGSQQGIDLVAKMFIDPQTQVAVEEPTYLAALQAFRLYGAEFVPLEWDKKIGTSLAYIVPTFANPTGACASKEQREALAKNCLAEGVTLFEDAPYRDLAYEDCERTPVVSNMKEGSWIYQGSFSKTFAPGLRIGFLAASPDMFHSLAIFKQAVDLHSCRLSQQIILQAITAEGWQQRLADLVEFYKAKRNTFDSALERHFEGIATWQVPAGGLFFWLRLNRSLDTRGLLDSAIAENVAFMPGEEFYPNAPEVGTMRLNFSHANPDQVDRGLATLASLVA